jgi:Zn-finger nucleic acid-binding protein
MLCPECNHNLLPISLKTKTAAVTVDYCSFCGGVWLEDGQVNQLSEEDTAPLSQLLPATPEHPTIRYNLCPKDRSTLQLFTAESIPATLSVLKCPTCRGLFFPDKNLLHFKTAQTAKINYFKAWSLPLHSIYAILIPIVLFVVLGVSLFATIRGVQQGQDVRSRAHEDISKPLVLHPADDQVVITFTTQTPAKTRISYWLNPDESVDQVISDTPQTNHTIVLRNLDIGKTYSFQVSTTEPQALTSVVYTFFTKEN